MDKKSTLNGALVAALFLVPTMGMSQKTGKSIKIVAIVSASGKPAQYGSDNKDGISLAVKYINSKGGINGRKIEIIWEQTDGLPDGVAPIARKYMGDASIAAILGPTTTDETTVLVNLLQQQNPPIPLLSVGSTGSWLPNNGIFPSGVFRSTRNDSIIVPNILKVIQQKEHPKTAAIIYHNDNAWSVSVLPIYEFELKKLGIRLVAKEPISKSSTDPVPQITKIRGANPDLIIVNTLAAAGIKAVAESRAMGMKSVFVGTTAFANPKAFTIGDKLNGVYNGDIYDPNAKTAENIAFTKIFQAEYKRQPPAYSAYGYAGTLLLAEALKRTKTPEDHLALQRSLGGLKNIHTVLGVVSYNGKGDITQRPAVLRIVNGTYQTVR